MKLSEKRFSTYQIHMLDSDGNAVPRQMYVYEMTNGKGLYDVLAVEDSLIFRKNMGAWTVFPEKIHEAIISHYNLNPGI